MLQKKRLRIHVEIEVQACQYFQNRQPNIISRRQKCIVFESLQYFIRLWANKIHKFLLWTIDLILSIHVTIMFSSLQSHKLQNIKKYLHLSWSVPLTNFNHARTITISPWNMWLKIKLKSQKVDVWCLQNLCLTKHLQFLIMTKYFHEILSHQSAVGDDTLWSNSLPANMFSAIKEFANTASVRVSLTLIIAYRQRFTVLFNR